MKQLAFLCAKGGSIAIFAHSEGDIAEELDLLDRVL